eukprot:CAMPEP_0184867680 /NCGR_PEP_ID=MMETSP0580-20130426/27465_1 /TAXON_ID=1118495 /ORGANISM="Dactyliosolen fragilissimus" /LENGTH=424 /DNA_ID=CAMNT_0027368103 /DNA_START=236 /DNA_END=1510 /DNA_ORIENTATION=-
MPSNTFLLLCCAAAGYYPLLMKLKKSAWLSMISNDPKNKPPIVGGIFHRLVDIQLGVPSSSGGLSRYEALYMYLNQWPVYFMFLLRFVAIVLPSRLPQMLFSKLKNGSYGTQSEQDVVDLIISVPSLYMTCKIVVKKTADPCIQENIDHLSDDDTVWQFQLPKEVPGVPFEGSIVHSDLTIIFLQKERRIIRATHQGNDVNPKLSSNMLFSIVASTAVDFCHIKSHIMAELSAKEITDKGIEALEPSARFVHGLHSGLLNSTTSPIVPESLLYSIGVTRQSLEDTFHIPMLHYNGPEKRSFHAYQFYIAARKSIATHLRSHNLKVSVEPLFQNMVIHSIEHHLYYEYLRHQHFSLDGSESFMSYVRSLLLIQFWTPPKINPIDDVRLCAVAQMSDTHTFYMDVYRDLKLVDPVLADHIITSTSF